MTRAEAAAAVGSTVTAHWPDPYVGAEVQERAVLLQVVHGTADVELSNGRHEVLPVQHLSVDASPEFAVGPLNGATR